MAFLSGLLQKEKQEKAKKKKILDVSTSSNHSPQMLQQNQVDVKESESDGLEDLWNEMHLALESSKVVERSVPVEKKEDCCHSFILKDDIGVVCQVCGIVQKRIETIFDYKW